MEAAVIAFLVLATATIAGAFILLWSKYVVHSTFGFMLALLGVAGFYVLLGSDFLAVTQVVVYVGGVVILYLFGIMLTPPDLRERNLKLIAACSLVACVVALYLIDAANVFGASTIVTSFAVEAGAGMPRPDIDVINRVGKGFLDREQYLLAFELASILLLVALLGSVYIARRKEDAK